MKTSLAKNTRAGNQTSVKKDSTFVKCALARTIVTGGAGFIGLHLCEALLQEGREVVCIDNFHTGRRSNVDHLLSDRNFEVIHHDITTPIFLQAKEVFNLACPASPVHYQFDPVHTMKTNVLGSINMLGLARRTGAEWNLPSWF